MIPGEMFIQDGEIELNAGRKTATLTVANTGDRPIQVGSHYHFFETNPGSSSSAKRRAACGSTSRPAPQCVSSRADARVTLVALAGKRPSTVSAAVMGKL